MISQSLLVKITLLWSSQIVATDKRLTLPSGIRATSWMVRCGFMYELPILVDLREFPPKVLTVIVLLELLSACT